jgi:hypothetical protein
LDEYGHVVLDLGLASRQLAPLPLGEIRSLDGEPVADFRALRDRLVARARAHSGDAPLSVAIGLRDPSPEAKPVETTVALGTDDLASLRALGHDVLMWHVEGPGLPDHLAWLLEPGEAVIDFPDRGPMFRLDLLVERRSGEVLRLGRAGLPGVIDLPRVADELYRSARVLRLFTFESRTVSAEYLVERLFED